MPEKISIQSIGIMGFGAFGQLIAENLQNHFDLIICDPGFNQKTGAVRPSFAFSDVHAFGKCDLVILAVPVQKLRQAIRELRPYLKKGAIVLDVGSVKMNPVEVMKKELPSDVDIIGTHPLFGPQSAKEGVSGLKIAICPVRGRAATRVSAFIKKRFGLKVYIVTPEKHDRDLAVVQGLTHLIAKVLLQMEPFPEHLTTASFDLIKEAIEMVRYDADCVYQAIETDNPFAQLVREEFFLTAEQVTSDLKNSFKEEPIKKMSVSCSNRSSRGIA
ncbi:MAG: prephenate dehydrogenase [Sneathiellales bacterium]|nr:prephenate dehydrogenase [Sneathiellales bacterium]